MAPAHEVADGIRYGIARFAPRGSRHHADAAAAIARDVQASRLVTHAAIADAIEQAIRRYAGPFREVA